MTNTTTTTERRPVQIALVTGHAFGLSALDGLVASSEYRTGDLELQRVLALHPRHSRGTVGYADGVAIAKAYGISAVYFNSAKSDAFRDFLTNRSPDFLLVIGLSQLVPGDVLALPAKKNNSRTRNDRTHGCIGMHPTLLPIGRGRAPLPWTILRGLATSGVTAFFMQDGADEGPVIAQSDFAIRDDETASSIFQKVANAHRKLALQLAPMLARRAVSSQPQADSQATVWPRRRPRDGWIDFRRPAGEIAILIRALCFPYPRAFFVVQDAIVLVDSAVPLRAANRSRLHATPGTLVDIASDGSPIFACGVGELKLVSWRSDGTLRFRPGLIAAGAEGVCIDE